MDLDIQLPKSWEELTSLKGILGPYGGETRLPEDQTFYNLYQELVPKAIRLEIIKRQMQGNDPALLFNNFSYTRILQHLPSVKHYVLWSLKGEVKEEKVREIVEEKFPGKPWMSFQTAVENKSVPEIWHEHIFVNDQ